MLVSVRMSNKKAHKNFGVKVYSNQLQIKMTFHSYK